MIEPSFESLVEEDCTKRRTSTISQLFALGFVWRLLTHTFVYLPFRMCPYSYNKAEVRGFKD